MTEPAMMPAESVARSAKVVPRPWLRRRESQLGDVLVGVSIGRSDLFQLLPATLSSGNGRSIKYSLRTPIPLVRAVGKSFGWLDAKDWQRWFVRLDAEAMDVTRRFCVFRMDGLEWETVWEGVR
jgi:hypothetical protein